MLERFCSGQKAHLLVCVESLWTGAELCYTVLPCHPKVQRLYWWQWTYQIDSVLDLFLWQGGLHLCHRVSLAGFNPYNVWYCWTYVGSSSVQDHIPDWPLGGQQPPMGLIIGLVQRGTTMKKVQKEHLPLSSLGICWEIKTSTWVELGSIKLQNELEMQFGLSILKFKFLKQNSQLLNDRNLQISLEGRWCPWTVHSQELNQSWHSYFHVTLTSKQNSIEWMPLFVKSFSWEVWWTSIST